MVKLNFYVTEQQKKALEKLSAQTGLTIAELLRRFIDAGLRGMRGN